MSEKILTEERARELNRRLIQGDKIDQDKVLGIGSAVDELLEIKTMLKDLRMKEKDNRTTLDAMHSIGLFLPMNEIKVDTRSMIVTDNATDEKIDVEGKAKGSPEFAQSEEQQDEPQSDSSTRWNEFGHGLFERFSDFQTMPSVHLSVRSESSELAARSTTVTVTGQRRTQTRRPFSAPAIPPNRGSLLQVKAKI
eukprot:558458-Hanusia_phi.AAC.3